MNEMKIEKVKLTILKKNKKPTHIVKELAKQKAISVSIKNPNKIKKTTKSYK